MFKVNNGLSVQLVSENSHFVENNYNLRHQTGTKFKVDYVNSETYGKQSASMSDLKSGIPYRKK